MKRYDLIIYLLLGFSIILSSCSHSSDNKKAGTEKIKENTKADQVKEAEVKDSSTEPRELKVKNGLVLVSDIDPSIVIDLRYAGKNNFTGKKIYPASVCLLRKETAEKLAKVNSELKTKGYRIKIWDGYRPYYVQQILYDAASDKSFLANPKRGSIHNRGGAVDLTIVDNRGREVVMPSAFDEFTIRASRNNPDMSNEARKNLDFLTSTMTKYGFRTIRSEWWHFEDTKASQYPILNMKLEEF